MADQKSDEKVPENVLRAGAGVIAEKWGICGMDIAPELARDVFLAMCAEKDRE